MCATFLPSLKRLAAVLLPDDPHNAVDSDGDAAGSSCISGSEGAGGSAGTSTMREPFLQHGMINGVGTDVHEPCRRARSVQACQESETRKLNRGGGARRGARTHEDGEEALSHGNVVDLGPQFPLGESNACALEDALLLPRRARWLPPAPTSSTASSLAVGSGEEAAAVESVVEEVAIEELATRAACGAVRPLMAAHQSAGSGRFTLQVRRGELILLVGAVGAGKSTLLGVMAGARRWLPPCTCTRSCGLLGLFSVARS